MRVPIISAWNYALIVGCTFALVLGGRSLVSIAEKDVRWTEGAHARATVLSRKGYGRWSEQDFEIRYRLDDVVAAGDSVLPGYDAMLYGADARDFAVGTQFDARYIRRDGQVLPILQPVGNQTRLLTWVLLVLGLHWPAKHLTLCFWKARDRRRRLSEEVGEWLATPGPNFDWD